MNNLDKWLTLAYGKHLMAEFSNMKYNLLAVYNRITPQNTFPFLREANRGKVKDAYLHLDLVAWMCAISERDLWDQMQNETGDLYCHFYVNCFRTRGWLSEERDSILASQVLKMIYKFRNKEVMGLLPGSILISQPTLQFLQKAYGFPDFFYDCIEDDQFMPAFLHWKSQSELNKSMSHFYYSWRKRQQNKKGA
ncbi:hypothetical protein [Moorena sp. SIO3A2]|uniref:hypothetical protein n=1 Tax=Moorena sp. SIO3A2 TaxID=2607841 RepID=UPI0013B6636C|nr:hypothetical protein [Moorena sp. SIO3A2]NER90328.1 hypothetical protein [Moorena sp. SIO3A2]